MRILFVGLPDSIHVARWCHQMSDQGWDIHLFPATSSPLHRDFRNITTYGFGAFRPQQLHASVRWRQLWPRRGLSRLSLAASRFAPGLSERAVWLARLIRQLKPDVVHSLEFQHAGYLTLAARKHLQPARFPTWAVSNWGSDIYLFGRLAAHRERIREILTGCDYYHCECQRDVELARSFGLRGEVLPVFPVTGGLDTVGMNAYRSAGETSSRRVIALKGYQNWAGRALVGLRAIELAAAALKNYKICIYMPDPTVVLAGELLSESTGIPVEVEEQNWTREHILRLHGRARISIGLSISDAISTSLLEAMALGSFPIQSNTGCANEWITCGENGLLVPAESPEEIASAIRRAIEDDSLVDRAARTNLKVISERADVSVVKPQIVSMYETIGRHSKLANQRVR